MDNQKDFYIKSRLQEDDLISKKADDIFNNFLRGETKMKDLNDNEKVVNISNSKDKLFKRKKILSVVATLVVVFLGVNVYAATQGYNNIFFIINNLFTPTEITDKNEILKDRDITISYQPINITDDLSIQVNRLVVKDNEAILYLDINNNSPKSNISNYAVYDITGDRNALIGNQIATNITNGRYTEEIKLVHFLNDTKVLQLDLLNDNYNNILSIEIDLENKEINILNGTEKELEKISEVELKKFLSDIVRINFFKDNKKITQGHTEQEYKNDIKVLYALELMSQKKAKLEDVHDVITEFSSEVIKRPLNLANIVVRRADKEYKISVPDTEYQVNALCLDISNIKYYDGVYTANCIYIYPTGDAYKEGKIEDLEKYMATIEFTINEEYEYSKFSVLNIDNIISSPISTNNEFDIELNDSNDSSISSDINEEQNSSDNEEKDSNSDIENNISNENTEKENIENTTEKIDNYASSMNWETFYTPGLKGEMPAEWNIEVYKDYYSGEADNGILAKSVSGLARGINKETNQIVDSYVTINFYMPEFIYSTDTYDYTKIIASRYNLEATEAGQTSKEGMDWCMAINYSNRTMYCHYEPMAEGEKGIGYVVEVICDNNENYKVINVLNKIFGDLKRVSF